MSLRLIIDVRSDNDPHQVLTFESICSRFIFDIFLAIKRDNFHFDIYQANANARVFKQRERDNRNPRAHAVFFRNDDSSRQNEN